MGGLIGEVLPFALALAAGPLHIIVIVLILVSGAARAKGIGFVGGRIAALVAIVVVVVLLVGPRDIHEGSPATGASIGRIVGGVLLVGLAIRAWRARPKPGEEPEPSALLRRVDGITPLHAVILGVLMTVLDPASLMLGLLVGLDVAQAGLSGAGDVLAVAIFVLVASSTLLVPLLIYLVGGAAAERKLLGVKSWLLMNEKTVMAVLFAILAVLLIVRGVVELAG